MSSSCSSSVDVYLRHSLMPLDEDLRHEFKGHRCVAREEVNPKNFFVTSSGRERVTRQAVSKYLCGMLNSGKGGTVYCGVLDDGTVEGMMMSPYQRDHLLLSLRDTFNRYRPRVPSHLYRARFVRVVDSLEEEVQGTNRARRPDSNPEMDGDLEHLLRSHRHCWCDDEALSMFNRGLMGEFYVIEIYIRPWDPKDPKNKGLMPDRRFPSLNPCFVAEDGKGYLRMSASNECYETTEDLARLTREQMSLLMLEEARDEGEEGDHKGERNAVPVC